MNTTIWCNQFVNPILYFNVKHFWKHSSSNEIFVLVNRNLRPISSFVFLVSLFACLLMAVALNLLNKQSRFSRCISTLIDAHVCNVV